MPVRTKAELETLVASLFPTNDMEAITAAHFRQYFQDVLDSVAFAANVPAAGVTENRVNQLIQAFFAAAVTGNTETNIAVTFDLATNKLNFVAQGGGGANLATVLAAILGGNNIDIDRSVASQITINYTPGHTGQHLRYAGWSADRTIQTADFAAAVSSTSDSVTLPAPPAGRLYPWFAVPDPPGWPARLFLPGGTRDQIGSFEQLTNTVDDPNGEPHIIGVAYFQQPALLAGDIRWEY